MRIRYLDKQVPASYDIKPASASIKLELTSTHQGKSYQLLGTSEKAYTFARRVWVGIRAFVKTIFSLGFALFRQATRDDWKSFWAGRRVEVVYTSSPFVAKQVFAKQGSKNDLYDLAVIYEKGENGVVANKQTAFEHYQKAADQGHLEAKLKVANMYENGEGVVKDGKKAVEYYKKAADQNDLSSLMILANIYKNGWRDVNKDPGQAFKYYVKLADQGCLDALLEVARMYEKEEGVVKNGKKAVEYYEKAASQDNLLAIMALANIYKKGLMDVEKDLSQAFKYYKMAEEKGHSDALLEVARMYEKKGVLQNRQKALEYYKKAADKGVQLAQTKIEKDLKLAWRLLEQDERLSHTLWVECIEPLVAISLEIRNEVAMIYMGGRRGIVRNYAKALECFKPLADSGHTNAQLQIARMYLNGGPELKKDLAKAMEYLKPLADNKEYAQCPELANLSAYAKLTVGMLYCKGGDGIERNYKKAIEYLEPLATSNADAKREVGTMYLEGGFGIEQDHQKALGYFTSPEISNTPRVSVIQQNDTDPYAHEPSGEVEESFDNHPVSSPAANVRTDNVVFPVENWKNHDSYSDSDE